MTGPRGLLAGRTLVAVFAHPDDESLACGGTLAWCAEQGARVVLLCATRGERGSISDRALVPDGDLGAARTRELIEAARELGVDEVVLLDHPDGSLRWRNVKALESEILGLLQRYRPNVVVTFGEDGLYWHQDHIAVFERTTWAVRQAGPAAPLLYYVTLPAGTMRGVAEVARRKRGSPPADTVWGINADAFGLATDVPTLVLDVRRYVPRKLAALRCHRTQLGPDNPLTWIDEADAERLLGVEHFQLAELPGRPREGLLEALRT